MFVRDKIAMDEESKDLWRKKIMPDIFLNRLEPSTDPIFDV